MERMEEAYGKNELNIKKLKYMGWHACNSLYQEE